MWILLWILAIAVVVGICVWVSRPDSSAKLQRRQVDVIYSMAAHKSVDALIDFLRNIFYYNQSYQVLVVIHPSPDVASRLPHALADLPFKHHVLVHPKPTVKALFTFDLVDAYFENARWCEKLGISARFMIPLASNCYFHRQLTDKDLDTELPPERFPQSWLDHHIPKFLENVEFTAALKEVGVKEFVGAQHEGLVIPWSVMGQMVELDTKIGMRALLKGNLPFEEILLPSLLSFFGRTGTTICKVFWESPDYTPTKDEIEQCNRYACVKRVKRSVYDPIRVWQREITNNYT